MRASLLRVQPSGHEVKSKHSVKSLRYEDGLIPTFQLTQLVLLGREALANNGAALFSLRNLAAQSDSHRSRHVPEK